MRKPYTEYLTNISLPSGLWSIDNYTSDSPYATYFVSNGTEFLFTYDEYTRSAASWAVSCNLSPCAKSYTARVTNGVLKEEQVGPTMDLTDLDNGTAINAGCLTSQQRQYLNQNGYHIENETQWIWYSGNNSFVYELGACYNEYSCTSAIELIEGPANISKNCIYNIFEGANYGISRFVTDYFNGSIVPDQDAFAGPSVLQALYNGGNATVDSMTAAFQSVADSMTAYIRQNGDADAAAPAIGVVYQENTCVRIRWPWLAFPAVLVCLTILFLVLMILSNTRQVSTAQDWKSSPLPYLFHGLDRDVVPHPDPTLPTKSKVMQDIAKSTHVQLAPSEQGWKLVKHD